jgi:hypothetical protein
MFVGALLATGLQLHAQSPGIFVGSTGNVGIGTASPSTNLDVSANATEGGLMTGQFHITGTNTNQRLVLGYDTTNDFGFIEAGIAGSLVKNIVLNPHGGGNVGIGTTAPKGLLDVESSSINGEFIGITASSTSVTSGTGSALILRNISATAGNYASILFYDANWNLQGSLGMMYGAHTGMSQGTFYIEPRIVGTPSAFVVAPSGNVGIGVANPAYMLDVAGQVHATSFVSATQTYADFVFKPGYKLPPLSDVEASIKKEGHLPGIPDEKEAKAHGIDLASMQVKLLQKIEELTLHQIDEEKKLSAQESQLSDQQGRLNDQAQRIDRLENENAALRGKVNL